MAVNDKGDVLQWGTAYAPGVLTPEPTLKGKNIASIALSKDKVIALSKDNQLYTFPISKDLQQSGVKHTESSWIPGRSSTSATSYRVLRPELGYLEKITHIAAGREHFLALTSSGRVFSSAAAYTYPSRGQLGIPGLTWKTRPTDKPIDVMFEITSLGSQKVEQIAAGDLHSVVRTRSGRAFAFGDNIHGQVGREWDPEATFYETPVLLSPPSASATTTNIAAGGNNTYLQASVPQPNRTTATEIFACGTGLHGNLGNGRWTHVQGSLTKIPSLSNLSEFSESAGKVQPIGLRGISVGANHAAAIMATSPGADVLWWGNNEFHQLGTGKRNNCNVPVYIQPLDGRGEEAGLTMTGSSSRGDKAGKMSGVIGGIA